MGVHTHSLASSRKEVRLDGNDGQRGRFQHVCGKKKVVLYVNKQILSPVFLFLKQDKFRQLQITWPSKVFKCLLCCKSRYNWYHKVIIHMQGRYPHTKDYFRGQCQCWCGHGKIGKGSRQTKSQGSKHKAGRRRLVLVVSSKFCQGQYSIIEWNAKESSTNESKDTLVPSKSPEATMKKIVCGV